MSFPIMPIFRSSTAERTLSELRVCNGEDLEIEKLVQRGMDKLPPTSRAKEVIEYAMEESRGLTHNCVGTEHILSGLLRVRDGMAAQALMDLGEELEDVRDEVVCLLSHVSKDQ
jgi:hypothetical protein